MDFSFTEDQEAVGRLAREILTKEISVERLRAAERDPDWFDRDLWATLVEAGLVGLAAPESAGGMGLGFLEACSFLVEVGRAVAPVPVMPVVVATLALAHHGTAEQQQRWLEPVAAGRAIVTVALDDAASADPASPGTRARRDDGSWVLSGCKRHVRAAHVADRLLVSAAVDEGGALFLVDPGADGVRTTRQRISTGEILTTVELDGVRVGTNDLVGSDAGVTGDRVMWLADRALVAACAVQVGVSERALEITAGHLRERVQFGVPIGSLQAVQQRAADAFIGLTAMRWCMWRAAWRLAAGLPASAEAAIAKFWAADAGSAIANAAQHLHGGLGVDLDYPIHRYFLWSKSLELELGSATEQVTRLGKYLAHAGIEERG